jgi:hypothetical protein
MTQAKQAIVSWPMRPLWILVTAAIVGGASLLAEGPWIICLLPLVGLVLSIVGSVGALRGRNGGETKPPRRAVRFGLLLAAIALLIVQIALGMAALGAARGAALSAIPQANLRGIGQALARYHRETGAYATSLHDLMALDLCSPRSLFNPFDFEADEARVRDQGYSSFVYQPGRGDWRPDPQVVLAYDRAPFSSAQFRLLRESGRHVLFADGEARWLTTTDFERQRSIDRTRRQEIGWPEPQPDAP